MATLPSTQRAQGTPSSQAKFLALLQQDILKLDLADLDFGIYRILNYRRAHVLTYLEDTLPSRINAWTHALAQASGGELASTEADNCYYHLHTFFARYWDDGDFIPRARRGGSAAYAVPYNGQDTHFHWATKGSHYVKSGELFARFAYKDGAQDIRFTLAQAELEKDNAKGSAKHFFPLRFAAVDGGFDLQWQWRAATEPEVKRYKNKSVSRPKDEAQDDIAPDTEGDDTATEGATLQERVLNDWLTGNAFAAAKLPAGLDPLVLASHARRFVRKNTSDFFVHPQLGEFLRGELDVYLKHEFVQVWDAPDAELPRIRAKFNLVRQIALDLIAFLNQIETFQATLFEKRKFVLQADYLVQCSWLQREGGAEGKKLLAEATDNAAQAEEWANWVGQKSTAKGTTKSKAPDGKKLLASYPHLPLHTVHFSADFKARVLACFDDIEAALGGELLHSDNYAALRTLEPAYRERVKCIYIDPPYNTDAGPIMYKNDLRDGSWLSMIAGRLKVAEHFMNSDGVLCATIDDYEFGNLESLIAEQYGRDRMAGVVAIRIDPSGRPKPSGFATAHEYAIFALSATTTQISRLPRSEEQKKRYKQVEADGSTYMWELFRKRGSNSERRARRKLYYPLYVNGNDVRVPRMHWEESTNQWTVLDQKTPSETVAYPIDDYGVERTWRWMADEARNIPDLLKAETSADGKLTIYYKYSPENEGVLATTVWTDSKYSATEHGTGTVKALFGNAEVFSYPKSIYAVQDCALVCGMNDEQNHIALDFFAGSATTGHAVINLNREDGGARKFLLVEQGEYFDAVTLPRIAKVMTSPLWKDGIPKDGVKHDAGDDPEHWSRRTLPLVRVLRLERYEDSLNALELDVNQPAAQLNRAQADMNFIAHDEQAQLLKYWLLDAVDAARTGAAPNAVCLSTASLNAPFDYQLTLHEPAGERLANVDMLETARLLLGLVPKKQRYIVDAQGQRHQLMEAVLASDLARGTVAPKPVLLWLRTVDDERNEQAAQTEHDWLVGAVQTHFNRPIAEYGTVFHNRSAFWPQSQQGVSLDALLAERMMERAR
jgi:adenine-specific DNA-methyltransferase